jgi:hypothetical protein
VAEVQVGGLLRSAEGSRQYLSTNRLTKTDFLLDIAWPDTYQQVFQSINSPLLLHHTWAVMDFMRNYERIEV